MNKDKQKQGTAPKNGDSYSTDNIENKINPKLVCKKQHHDPKNAIKKPYKFGILRGSIFETQGKITKLI